MNSFGGECLDGSKKCFCNLYSLFCEEWLELGIGIGAEAETFIELELELELDIGLHIDKVLIVFLLSLLTEIIQLYMYKEKSFCREFDERKVTTGNMIAVYIFFFINEYCRGRLSTIQIF